MPFKNFAIRTYCPIWCICKILSCCTRYLIYRHSNNIRISDSTCCYISTNDSSIQNFSTRYSIIREFRCSNNTSSNLKIVIRTRNISSESSSCTNFRIEIYPISKRKDTVGSIICKRNIGKITVMNSRLTACAHVCLRVEVRVHCSCCIVICCE